MSGGFEETARSWIEHLRHGGVTGWTDWAESRRPRSAGVLTATEEPLPGSAQLEFVRRLGEAGPPGPGFTSLADRALARSGHGRGLPELPLPWAAGATPAIGPPPRDPATIPDEELLRVGVGVLADLLLELPDVPVPTPRRGRRRPWTRQFHLAGAPLTVLAVREALAAKGHRESRGNPDVVLIAMPVDARLFEAWTSRVRAGASPRWGRFVARCAGRDELPPSADLLKIARHWRGVVGPERIHVVADPADPVGQVSRILGLSARRTPVESPAPENVDVLRRLNGVLRSRVEPDRTAQLLVRARALLPASSGQPLGIPTRQVAWAVERTAREREGLRADGYVLHGDLDRIAPRATTGSLRPHSGVVLDLVVAACRELADEPGEGVDG